MGSSYKTWKDLQRKVIKPALEELKDNNFIYVDIKPIKECQTNC